MDKILITGANGQLGNEIRGLSYTHPYRGSEFIFADIEDLDISDKEQVRNFFKKHSPSLVINCAAYTNVDRAETDYDIASAVNGSAVGNMIDCCMEDDVRFIHVSTDYVFDGNKPTPYSESDSVNPLTVYGKTKLAGENFVLAYSYGTVVRTSWLYSTYGHNFFNTILKKGSELDSIKVVFDQAGTPTYAKELAKVLLKMALMQLDGKNENLYGIFHFSNEGVCSWYDFAIEIINLAQLPCKVLPVLSSEYPTPAIRPGYSVLNKDKIKSALSVEIPHWKISLANCIEHIK